MFASFSYPNCFCAVLLATILACGGINSAEAQYDTSARTVALAPADARGVQPIVVDHLLRQSRETITALGYTLASEGSTTTALSATGGRNPRSAAELWRYTLAANADRGILPRVWVESNRYVIEMIVASIDGSGPYTARNYSGADDFHQVVDQTIRSALPGPSQWDENAAAGYRQNAAPVTQVQPGQPNWNGANTVQGSARPPRTRRPGQEHRFDLGVFSDSIFGQTDDAIPQRFYGHNLNLRAAFRLYRVNLGVQFGYLNMPGRNGRASNISAMAFIETRIPVGTPRLTIPLYLGFGGSPRNGSIIRVAGGINFAVTDDIEIQVDPLGIHILRAANEGSYYGYSISIGALRRF